MPAPTISYSKASTPTKFGGDALNNVNNYLNGIDVTSQIGTPIIRTPTKIPSDKLLFTDPAEDNTVTVKIPSLSANKNINLIPSNVTDNDEVLYKDSIQTITGKIISASSNTIQNIDTDNISDNAVITNKILDNAITDAKISSHTSTKLTITTKAQLNSQIAYKDENNWLTLNHVPDQLLTDIKINNNLKEKVGKYHATIGGEIVGEGWLSGLYGLGNISNNQDSVGVSNICGTGSTTSNLTAGMVKIQPVGSFNGWTRPSFLPYINFRDGVPARTSNDSRFYYGWYTTSGLVPAADSNPMTVSNGGVLIGYHSTEPNIMIYYGPGDGVTSVPTPINTGVAIPNGSIAYGFEINFTTSTSIVITITNINTSSVLYTNSSSPLTTNIPGTSKSLNFHNVIQNTTTTNKNLTIYSGHGRAVK